MDERWTLAELVSEAATRIAALPAPKNGQIRAVPDERTIRYYATIGLLDRPAAMRGRTALYNRRHLAQVVAIKRLQSTDHSLADIQTLWPTFDDDTLARMSGVPLTTTPPRRGRADFWKKAPGELEPAEPPAAPAAPSKPTPSPPPPAPPPALPPQPGPARAAVATPVPPDTGHGAPDAGHDAPDAGHRAADVRAELVVELAPGIRLAIEVPADAGFTLTPDDADALRASAVELVELTRRRLTATNLPRNPRTNADEGDER